MIHVKDILPEPFEWVEIPAGVVELENSSKIGGSEGGQYQVEAFKMAKYPVTNAQYQVFVEAIDGYSNPHWWDYSSDAQKWRVNRNKPKDSEFSEDNLPRTIVCWYDALAFCNWLSQKIEQKILLPTEQQWQRAAQGDDGRLYPWGNEVPDDRLCTWLANNNQWQPTPVTYHPNGASPYGVMDMSGNVNEWCLSKWGSESVNIQGPEERIIRGGAWDFGRIDLLRVINRNGAFPPGAEFDNIGFRCICVME